MKQSPRAIAVSKERGEFRTLNRQERRRQGIKEKPKIIHITTDYLDKLKQDISKEATQVAFQWMMCLPLMVIHDKFNEIRLKEFDGVCREEHFFDLCLELYESFNLEYVTLNDLAKTILDETGFDVTQRFIQQKGFERS